MTARRRRRSIPIPLELPARSAVFDARPDEILALRKAIGWTRMDFGALLAVYLNVHRGDCETVRRWERGLARPQRVHRSKMLLLVEKYHYEYLQTLRQIRDANPAAAKPDRPSEAGITGKSPIPISRRK